MCISRPQWLRSFSPVSNSCFPFSDCNICHAPKFGKIEERTGAGGGFNERGIVEYNEKVESDDEYDDVSHDGDGWVGTTSCGDWAMPYFTPFM